jgi:hypothetical protein
MVNWKYIVKNAAFTAIHAHISLWNGFGRLLEKYSIFNLVSEIAPNMLKK